MAQSYSVFDRDFRAFGTVEVTEGGSEVALAKAKKKWPHRALLSVAPNYSREERLRREEQAHYDFWDRVSSHLRR